MRKYLHKFSLNQCDLPTIIWNVAVLLRLNTINIDRNCTRIPWIFYPINIIASGVFFYIVIFSMSWQIVDQRNEPGHLTVAAVTFSVCACSCPAVTKFIYMKVYSVTVKNLVDEYIKCDLLVIRGTRYATNLRKYLRVMKKRATLIWIFLVVNGMMYLLVPFLRPGRHLAEDLLVIYGLEPMFESPNYEVAKTLQTVAVCFVVFTLSNTTTFVVTIVGYIEAKMLALSQELLHLWKDNETFCNKYRFNAEVLNEGLESDIRNIFVRRRLHDIVKFHIMCIHLRDCIEKELRFIFVVEFLFMMLGTVAELLGGLKNTYLQIPFTFIQLFMDCYAGQRLLDASNIFENSVYECMWEYFNISNQKTVLIILQCCQRPLTLSAGGIAILSYTCLMSVMKTTYSTYTTLQSTVE